jgi:hypothetical protein
MVLGNRSIDELTEHDLQALVSNQVAESKSVEYKETLPGGSNNEKREFLADVTSFANAAGGHLIYGIRESDGIPDDLCGLGHMNADENILRLENLLRDGVQPRIPGVSLQPVPLGESNVALVIRVSRGWASPHRVTHGGHGHFYSRNSAGKYQMDVSELRNSFLLAESAIDKIREFRTGRIRRINGGQTPVPMMVRAAKLILHIVPVGHSDPASQFAVSELERDPTILIPIYSAGWSHRHNFDGIVSFDMQEDKAVSYLQIFRNGCIEAVDTALLYSETHGKTIPSRYERDILDSLRRFLGIQQHLGVEPPLFVMLSLTGVQGYTMAVERRFRRRQVHEIDRDSLVTPEVIVDSYDSDPAQFMRPAFDSIWNAAGWPRSMNYAEDG